jgi:hypothetical protein
MQTTGGVKTTTPFVNGGAPTTTKTHQRIDAAQFRATFGGPSQRATAALAKRLNIRLTNTDSNAAHELDLQMRIANQTARPLVAIDDGQPLAGIRHFGADTIGGAQIRSYHGNKFVIQWMDLHAEQRRPYVTCAADHSAAASQRGVQVFVQDSGFDYVVNQPSVTQNVTFSADNGTEFLGTFHQQLVRDGVRIRNGTAHKHNTNYSGVIERSNRQLQARMRANLMLAKQNVDADGHELNRIWDLAITHGALQERLRLDAEQIDVNDTDAVQVLARRINRLLIAPFGSRVTATLAPTAPARAAHGKQLAPRGVNGLFVGVDRSGRYIIMLPGASGASRFTHTVDMSVQRRATTATDTDFGDLNFTEDKHAIDAGYDTQPGIEAPTLVDKHGAATHVGDRVSYTWAPDTAEAEDYEGEVTAINRQECTINYDIWDPQWGSAVKHTIEDAAQLMTVLLNVTTMTTATTEGTPRLTPEATTVGNGDTPSVLAAKLWVPHKDVAAYVDEDGQILPDILTGERALPPPLALPDYYRHDHPGLPRTLKECLSTPAAIHWLHGAVEEFSVHYRTPSFRLRRLRGTGKARRGLHAKWCPEMKWDSNGKLRRIKMRLVLAAVNRVRGEDYQESYIGSPPISDLRTLECVAIMKGWKRAESDVTCAYVSADMPPKCDGTPVIAALPEGSRLFDEQGEELCLELLRALYGWPASGWAWARKLHGKLTSPGCPVTLKQSAHQPNIFYATFEPTSEFAGSHYFLWVNVDNVRHYYDNDKVHRNFMQWYSNEFNITGGDVDLGTQPPQVCLGMTMTYTASNGIAVSVKLAMDAYILDVLTKRGMQECNPNDAPLPANFMLSPLDKPETDAEQQEVVDRYNKVFHTPVDNYAILIKEYQSMVQALNWLATMVAPTLRTAVSILARGSHYPCEKGVRAIKQTLRYTKGLMGKGITYTKGRDYGPDEYPELIYGSDASYANHSDAKCQGGYTGRFIGQAITSAVSGKSSTVATSTCHAELYWASECSRQIMYEVQLLHEIGIKVPLPVVHHIDNAAAVIDAGSPIRRFSQRTKHFLIAEKYAQQCSEMGITKITKIDGNLLDADAMTKALPGVTLKRHTDTLICGDSGKGVAG